MSADLSQFYQAFFDETAEHLAEMERLLLGLNVSNPALDDFNAIFRSAHSIKGGAGTFGFNDMTEVTHILETLLDKLRKQEMGVTAEMVNVFLEACDVINMQLATHRGGDEINASAVGAVCGKLERLSAAYPSAPKESMAGKTDAGFGQPEGADAGFFDCQPSVPATGQAVGKEKTSSAAEMSVRSPVRRGGALEIHGQGFGFFEDELTPAVRPVPASNPPAGRGEATHSRREGAKEGADAGTAGSVKGSAPDFGLFQDKSGAPAQESPKKLNPLSTQPDADAAEQKIKRDFHGKGFGFF